jgi:fructokinase
MKKKILSIGEIIWDIYPDKKTIGGAPLNFAAHAVLCGADSTLVSAIGGDSLGEAAIQALVGFGVNCRYVKKTNRPTGQCIVTLDKNAVPHYNVLRGVAYDNIALDNNDFERISEEKYDALYFGTLIQREEVSRKTVCELLNRCVFSTIICDVNLRPNCYNKDSVSLCLNHATILKVSIEEEPFLRSLGGYIPDNDSPEAIAMALSKAYPQLEMILITLGKDGSYAYSVKDCKSYYQKSIGDIVVSTVGAGDSFAAAWLISYLEQKPIEECMKKAAEISGFVVAHTQAVPIY